MRLSKYHKDAIVDAIMKDTPDPAGVKRKEAEALYHKLETRHLPQHVRLMYEDNRQFFLSEGWSSVNIAGMSFTRKLNVELTLSQTKDVEVLVREYNKLRNDRSNLRVQLRGAVYACSTRKSFIKAMPEFEKYAPHEEGVSQYPVVITNIVADLVKAGWPDKKEK